MGAQTLLASTLVCSELEVLGALDGLHALGLSPGSSIVAGKANEGQVHTAGIGAGLLTSRHSSNWKERRATALFPTKWSEVEVITTGQWVHLALGALELQHNLLGGLCLCLESEQPQGAGSEFSASVQLANPTSTRLWKFEPSCGRRAWSALRTQTARNRDFY